MAKKIETTLVDDIDGTDAVATHRFGAEGAWYEIDLNAKHSEQFTATLGRYIAKGRQVSAPYPTPKRPTRRRRSPTRPTATAELPSEIRDTLEQADQPIGSTAHRDAVRAWARKKGFKVADRGRIPEAAMAAYRVEVLGG